MPPKAPPGAKPPSKESAGGETAGTATPKGPTAADVAKAAVAERSGGRRASASRGGRGGRGPRGGRTGSGTGGAMPKGGPAFTSPGGQAAKGAAAPRMETRPSLEGFSVGETFGSARSMQWNTNPMQATLTRSKSKGEVSFDSLGLPIRASVQALYRVYRSKTIWELFVFLLFFGLFYFMAWEVYDPHVAFTSDDALLDLFLDEEFEGYNHKMNFEGVNTMGQVWDWLEGPMYNGLYADEWYNGRQYSEYEEGYVLHFFRLVGGVQLRQMRVRRDSCQERRFVDLTAPHEILVNGNLTTVELGKFDTRDGSCYAAFDSSTEDREPFTPAGGSGIYNWSDGHHFMEGLFGFGPDYGTGGYVQTLPLNKTAALEQLVGLKEDGWTDRGTRALAVSFNLYNTQTKLLTSVRLMFEFFMSGKVLPSFKFFTIKMVVYESKMDQLRRLAELLYLAMNVYYFQREARRWYHKKRRILYFASPLSCLEVLILILNLVAVVSWGRFTADPLRRSFDVNSETFIDMYTISEHFVNTVSWAGVLGLLYAFKMFKFLAVSRKMTTVFMTLSRAGGDLSVFMFGFLIIVFGFSLMANWFFGHLLRKYHTLSSSFSSLLRYPLGDFDYRELLRARPSLAAGFFTAYNLMVFLVIMNMFIGIITKYFDEVHEELKSKDAWKHSMLTYEGETWMWLLHRLRKLRRRLRCKKLDPFQDREEHEALLEHERNVRRETEFLELMHQCMRSAKMSNNVDLYLYFEKLIHDVDSDNLHIGVHEICTLVQVKPCSSHNTCLARRVVEAFNKTRVVLMVGSVRAHKPVTSNVARYRQAFEVLKIDGQGGTHKRYLVVYKRRGLLLNFDAHMRLRKKLPLKQLLQLERSTVDPRRLALVFTAKGMSFKDEHQAGVGTMETKYEVTFVDGASWREHFIEELQNAVLMVPHINDNADGESSDEEMMQKEMETTTSASTMYRRASRRASGAAGPAGTGGLFDIVMAARSTAGPQAAAKKPAPDLLARLGKQAASVFADARAQQTADPAIVPAGPAAASGDAKAHPTGSMLGRMKRAMSRRAGDASTKAMPPSIKSLELQCNRLEQVIMELAGESATQEFRELTDRLSMARARLTALRNQ